VFSRKVINPYNFLDHSPTPQTIKNRINVIRNHFEFSEINPLELFIHIKYSDTIIIHKANHFSKMILQSILKNDYAINIEK